MFVSVVLQWEDHALKLHRYHVRFQRFIRTSDHGSNQGDESCRKNPVPERKIPHTTSVRVLESVHFCSFKLSETTVSLTIIQKFYSA